MKKKIIIYLNIVLMTIVCTIAAVSYAIFSSSINANNASIIGTSLPNGSYIFNVTNASNITYEVTAMDMLPSEVSRDPIAEGSTSLDIQLASPDSKSKVVCTYDIIWEWISADQYTTSSVSLPYKSGNRYYYHEMEVVVFTGTEGYLPFEEPSCAGCAQGGELSEFNWSNSKTIIGSDMIASTSSIPTSKHISIDSYIFNIPVEQTSLKGKNLKAKVYLSNINCTMSPYTPTIISGNLTTIGSEVQIGDQGFYVLGEDETNSSNVKLISRYLLGYNEDNSIVQRDDGYDKIILPFSSSIYWVDEEDYIYDKYYNYDDESYYVYDSNSNLYEPVESYKNLLIDRYDLDIITARLLTYDEAYTFSDEAYEIASMGAYWTGEIDTYDEIWLNYFDDGIWSYDYDDAEDAGIRPVIIVPKSIFN